MDFLDSARKAFGKAADGVSRGAEAVRLETEIADLSRRVTDDWAAAGRRAQALVRLGRAQDNELTHLVEQAEALEEKLLAAQQALQAMRQGQRMRRCPGCGASIVKLTEFCEECGRKLPVCKDCLEPLSAGDTECPSCKTPVGGTSPGPAEPTE